MDDPITPRYPRQRKTATPQPTPATQDRPNLMAFLNERAAAETITARDLLARIAAFNREQAHEARRNKGRR